MNTTKTMVTLVTATAVAATGLWGVAQAQDDTASSTTTRGEVRAQLAAARASGEYGVWNGEDSGSHHLSRQPWRSATPRRAVAAAAAAARSAHAMAGFEGEGNHGYAGPDAGERSHPDQG